MRKPTMLSAPIKRKHIRPTFKTYRSGYRWATPALAALLLFASASLSAPQKAKLKARVTRPDPVEGKLSFVKFCASCHGETGKGDGPVAESLKPRPADLTSLTKSNGGNFPAGFVAVMMKFGRNVAAHGSSDMPVWGSRFKAIDPKGDPTGQQHIDDVVAYIVSLQAK